MNKKLTLSVEESAILKGKSFAASNGATLSGLVETFLLLLGKDGQIVDDVPISSKLQSLVGIGSGATTEASYRRHLVEKNG